MSLYLYFFNFSEILTLFVLYQNTEFKQTGFIWVFVYTIIQDNLNVKDPQVYPTRQIKRFSILFIVVDIIILTLWIL